MPHCIPLRQNLRLRLAVAAGFHSRAAEQLLCETPSFFRIVASHYMNETLSNASARPHANAARQHSALPAALLQASRFPQHHDIRPTAGHQPIRVSRGPSLPAALRFGAIARKRVCAELWAPVRQMLECMARRSGEHNVYHPEIPKCRIAASKLRATRISHVSSSRTLLCRRLESSSRI